MPWYILPLISALVISVSTILEKKVLFKEHATEFSTVFALFNAVLCIPFAFLADFSNVSWQMVLIMFLGSVVATTSFLLTAKSARHMEVSSTSSWMVLAPAITAVFAFLFLGEKLGSQQIFGIGLMLVGVYILQSHQNSSIWDPIREIYHSKYILFIIISLFLYAIGAMIDKVSLTHMGVSVFVYVSIVHFFIALNFFVISYFMYDGVVGIKHGIKTYGWLILLISVLAVAQRTTMTLAISTTMLGLVLPIKRMSSLFTTIIGGELFHEKNLGRKIFACIVMLSGLVFMVV